MSLYATWYLEGHINIPSTLAWGDDDDLLAYLVLTLSTSSLIISLNVVKGRDIFVDI